jgi:hypothetical protein
LATFYSLHPFLKKVKVISTLGNNVKEGATIDMLLGNAADFKMSLGTIAYNPDFVKTRLKIASILTRVTSLGQEGEKSQIIRLILVTTKKTYRPRAGEKLKFCCRPSATAG